MKILKDLYGRLVNRLPDDEMQTDDSKLAHLKQTFSEHPSNGLTPPKLASILLEAERGNLQSQCELAEDIEEKDAHIFAELQKRKRALLSLPRSIKPPRNPSAAEQRDTDMLNEWLEDTTALNDLILNMGDGILKGFSNHELEWRTEEGLLLPDWHFRDPSWFQVHPEQQNQLRLQDQSYTGQALQPFGWISHKHQAKSGYLARSALVRILAWPYLFKNFSVRDLAEFLEIYGLPIRVGEYPSGASDKEKATLLKAVMGIGHNAGGIIPRGMSIDFKEAAKGASDPFTAMMTWCEQSESKAILGGTLTSQADGKTSTNALGNVHNEVRIELRDSDATQLADTLTRDLIFPLYALNGKSFDGSRRMPRFEFDLTEPEDMAYYAQHLPNLVNMGVPVPVNWVQSKLQIPVADEDEPVLQSASSQPAMLSQPFVSLTRQTGHTDSVARLTDLIHEHTAPAQDAMIDQIRQLVEQAESFDQLKAQLMALNVDHSDLGGLIGEALHVAGLGGRYELIQDALT